MLQLHLIVKSIQHPYCKGKGRHFSMAVAHDDSKPAGYRTKDNSTPQKVPANKSLTARILGTKKKYLKSNVLKKSPKI